jgi:hypothetical protein
MKMATKVQKAAAKKLVKATNRRITRDNKAFEKMTLPEKRVQIARDVLAQLASKRLKAESGVWLEGKGGKNLFTKADIKADAELSDILSKTKECSGCALGGMFMCSVERADNLKIGKLEAVRESDSDHTIAEDDAFSYLKKFFTKTQLDMIESAFERGGGACYHSEGSEFVMDIDDPQTRMRLIMENIIANKGTFRPNKAPVAVWTTPGFQG